MSLVVSIVDHEGNNQSMVIGIESVSPSQLRMPPCVGPVVTPSQIAVEFGIVSSISSSGGALSKFIHNIPLSFVDHFSPIIITLSLHSRKSLDMLLGWWY